MKIHKKLMQARIELQRKELNKSGHNKFANYKYFELSDFLNELDHIHKLEEMHKKMQKK
jgi:hypothetical protein